MSQKVWAAYSSVARYGTNDISLFSTERDAYTAIAESIDFSNRTEEWCVWFWGLFDSNRDEFYERFRREAEWIDMEYCIQEVAQP